jgi:steroid delta-isomerase-like uncharacterized protein
MSNANLIVRWFDEVWNKGRRDAIAEMLSADAVIHDGATDSRGPEGFYPFYDRMHGTFSHIKVTIHESIAERDMVCARWSATMLHSGDGFGVPATHKPVNTTGISIIRVADGKLVEGWQNWDMLGLLEQIRATSTPAKAYIGTAGA